MSGYFADEIGGYFADEIGGYFADEIGGYFADERGFRDLKAPGEWFVLQERKPGTDWEDVMSFGGWHDPDARWRALKVFRDSEERKPGEEYRMVRRTESVLSE